MRIIQRLIFGTPEEKWKNGCGILFLILGILSFFVCLLQAFGQDIWFDEVFSVNFIQHSYKEIAVLTGKDVHPPLYYWYLKLFHDIGKVLVPAASSIVLCKLASMLPFVGIFVYTLTAIRKNFGLHTAGLFWFLIMTMPQISNYTVEIRMYSLALFFITAAFVHSCELVRAFPAQGVSEAEGTAEPGVAAGTEETAEPEAAGSEVTSGAALASGSVTGENGLIKWWKKNKHWLLFWGYGILTAYIQYYACVAVIAIYIALFVFFVVKAHKGKTEKTSCKKTHIYKEQLKEQEAILTKAPVKGWKAEHTTEQETGRIAGKCIGKVLLCAGLSVLAYLPWLPFFFSQVRTVSSSYWIQPLTWKSIFGCMKYIFLPVSYAVKKNYVLACVMILLFGAAFLYSFLMKRKDARGRFFLLTGLWIAVFTTLIGFVCSILNRPIFVYRYLIPCLGAMWLVAAVVLWDFIEKNWGILLFVPFLLSGYSNMQGFYGEENKKIAEMKATQSFLADFPKDAVVLCNFNHVQAVTACYLKDSNEIWLYGSNPEDLIAELLPQCRGLEDTTELSQLVKERNVYFFGSFNSREELLKEWETEGIAYTEEGTYLLERYYFNVYHLVTNQSHVDP
ncbi:MAG: hypothetical protein DBY33_00775 [Lachnospiraceae bacterium]|nr:MAG: hypothetical protein DBY33_00775 [Lachnospiraceae bacterium]